MVGLSTDPAPMLRAASILPCCILIVYLARSISVWTTLWPLNAIKRIPPISSAYQAVLIWGGLRGGLALALVLLLPDSFEQKGLFLDMATAVVLCTLLLNALTTSGLMRRLKLDRLTPQEQYFYSKSLEDTLEHVFHSLSPAVRNGNLSSQMVASL